MINPITSYQESGRKAGIAAKKGDQATVNFETNWFNKARQLEKENDRIDCSIEWRIAYREGYKG